MLIVERDCNISSLFSDIRCRVAYDSIEEKSVDLCTIRVKGIRKNYKILSLIVTNLRGVLFLKKKTKKNQTEQ